MDDVWALFQKDGRQLSEDALGWLPLVTDRWAGIGVVSHPAKAMDEARYAEIQGGKVHPTPHRIGLGALKTYNCMIAGAWLCSTWRPARHSVERYVGKVGHAHTFRTACRASFGRTFKWIDELREAKAC